MDQALKQRMLGAAVLIVLAIIFVPMLLDGAPHPDTQTVDLGIPKPPDREFETRVVPLDPQSTSPAAALPDPNHIATVDTASTPKVDALAGQEPADASPAPPATPTPAPVTEPAPPPADPVPAAAPRGRYVVSFGSYAKPDNANALVAAFRKAKITAYADTVDVNGQPGLRVRAGPYVDRAEAEKVRLLAKQVRADAPGTIVEVDDTPKADTPAPAATARAAVTGWAVQVGAYQSEGDANAQRDKLRGGGFAAFVETLRTEKGALFRVRVGPETQRANAEKLRDALKSRFSIDGLVVAHPG